MATVLITLGIVFVVLLVLGQLYPDAFETKPKKHHSGADASDPIEDDRDFRDFRSGGPTPPGGAPF